MCVWFSHDILLCCHAHSMHAVRMCCGTHTGDIAGRIARNITCVVRHTTCDVGQVTNASSWPWKSGGAF